MCTYIKLGNLVLPSYSLMIVLGIMLSYGIAAIHCWKKSLSYKNVLILAGFGIGFGLIGAKVLFLIVSYKEIAWSHIFEIRYFLILLRAGYVFYGGLIFSIIAIVISAKVFKINLREYLLEFVYLIPFAHAFGRIGCFMAGCCYGRPYDGPFAVVFPEETFGLAGVKLFPIQIVEAIFLFLISFIVFIIIIKGKSCFSLSVYFVLYAILRFILEYYRYDYVRGFMFGFSTSQWISILIFVVGGVSLFANFLRYKRHIKNK